ncbi:MAG TPA: alpha/beta fold hydrolase [Steroidobacteraceae bacterium]|jgi:homoserine O-acetyltransferase|nr:alpha/beta fold hydrolase [Steroidobacteraceae bacterium]
MLKRFAALLVASTGLAAAQVPKPQYLPTHWPIHNVVYHIHDYRFGTGETLPDLRLHYVTLGQPRRDAAGHVINAVLLIHGTSGDAHSLLNPVFSDVLFGPGQPLDITRYFVILPDLIGHGESSKPSDGLRMKFPRYTYDDMVRADHEVLLDDLHVDHLRLVLGTSMGCMQSFVWGEMYPRFIDALMPLACMPMEIAGRNRIFRYMAIRAIRDDPNWDNGNYTRQPIEGLRGAANMFIIAGSAPQQMQKDLPTRKQAEAYFDQTAGRLVARFDADDLIYQLDASRDYNPEPRLGSISAYLMWINSGDDFINPPELSDIAHKLVRRIPHGRYVLIPASMSTYGHGTHTHAAVWKQYLIELLAESARH